MMIVVFACTKVSPIQQNPVWPIKSITLYIHHVSHTCEAVAECLAAILAMTGSSKTKGMLLSG